MRVVLDPPPSANRLWEIVTPFKKGGGRGRPRLARTKEYQSWLNYAILKIKTELSPVKSYPIEVRLTIHGGKDWRSDRDCDNAIKPTLDASVKAGILENDSVKYITRASVSFVRVDKPKTAVVVEYLPVESSDGPK